MKKLSHFTGGNKSGRDKLNDIVDVLNRLQNMRGSGGIMVKETAGGYGFHLSMNQLLPRIPTQRDWQFRVISGTIVGKDNHYFHPLDDDTERPEGYYIDEVPFDTTLHTSDFFPSRTRDIDNNYIDTIIFKSQSAGN